MGTFRFAWALGVALLATACSQQQPAVAQRPVVSYRDIMVEVIDPAAGQLWDSVSTEITQAGVVERAPTGEEDWQALRRHSVGLVESANLLLIAGRPLAAPGQGLDNRPGYLSAEEIGRIIDANRPAYGLRVEEFRTAAVAALAAVEARKPAAIVDAGARLQQACEHCHLQYWYPNGGPPPAAELFAKTTKR